MMYHVRVWISGPRERGEHDYSGLAPRESWGTSPRTRRTRSGKTARKKQGRIIPASAGNTSLHLSASCHKYGSEAVREGRARYQLQRDGLAHDLHCGHAGVPRRVRHPGSARDSGLCVRLRTWRPGRTHRHWHRCHLGFHSFFFPSLVASVFTFRATFTLATGFADLARIIPASADNRALAHAFFARALTPLLSGSWGHPAGGGPGVSCFHSVGSSQALSHRPFTGGVGIARWPPPHFSSRRANWRAESVWGVEPGRWTREAGMDEIRDEIGAQDDQPGQEPMSRRRHDVLSPEQRRMKISPKYTRRKTA